MKDFTMKNFNLLRSGIFFAFFFLLCIIPFISGSAQTDSVEFDGITRYYNLHIPESYDEDSVPLLIAIHGWSRSPETMEYHSHLSDKSEEEGFIVAYPKASGDNPLTWYTDDAGVDDAGYISFLIDTLCSRYNIDTTRIYVTGFSNGAELTYKVAQRYGDKIAGIAPVACYWWDTVTPPVHEVPIIEFHSEIDGSVPISGAQPVLDHWIDYNGCSTTPDTFYIVPGAKGVRWIDETDGNDIVFFYTKKGGHSWPGGETSWSKPSDAISATDLMWKFFNGELEGALPVALKDSMDYDGMTRYYNLHMPALYSTHDTTVPLMVALHGLARSPELMENHTHLSDKSEEEGFITVYPKGTGSPDLEWNLEDEGVDDAGFINALIDTLVTYYRIDMSQVYVTGFSNGAELTYKVAQRYGNKIAGIAPVAAYWWDNENPPVKALPVITFHAQNDPFVDYSGVQPQLDHWISFNECQADADTFYADEGVLGVRWTDEENGNDVVFFTTETGEHSWPGGEESWAVPSQAINATDMIWDFFTAELPVKEPEPVSTKAFNPSKKLHIYPNPARNDVFIEGNFGQGTMEIYTLNGIKIKAIRITFANVAEKVDISDLTYGLYEVRLTTDDLEVYHGKLFVAQ